MLRLSIPTVAVAALLGCSENSLNGAKADQDTFLPGDTDAPGEPVPPPGPEVEDDFLAQPPASTPEYVFVANRTRDTLTRIRAADQDVLTVGVGREPTLVQTTPDGLLAVSFNRGDDTVTVVDTATMEATTLDVRDDFNAMDMTPDGRFVLLWHDLNAETEDDLPTQGLQSYNEISVVDLQARVHTPMAVGFNPRDVAFSRDSALGAVVSDDALALVDFTQAPLDVPTLVPLSSGLLDPPDAEEVVLEPGGTYAFIRRYGDDALQTVDLQTLTVGSIPMAAGLTDMDLSPDGGTLAVVCRDAREIRLVATRFPNDPQSVLPFPVDLPLGALVFAPTGGVGILYTTASPIDRYVRWDLATDTLTARALVKPVAALSISPTGEDMLVVHTRADAPDAELGPFYGEWALTMVDLTLDLPTPMRLPAEPIGFANAPGGRRAYFIMKDEPLLEVLDYHTRLYEEVTLRSAPVWVGSLPDPTPADADTPYAWVSQEHELGRISFYDPDDGAFETLTGFELNAAIED
ncbi:MAG: hypothetical protein R3F61_24090 [Myxococcota bacterium]